MPAMLMSLTSLHHADRIDLAWIMVAQSQSGEQIKYMLLLIG
jgi:hypothetical protein